MLALPPLLIERLIKAGQRAAYTTWIAIFLIVTMAGIASLGMVEYSPPATVFEL